MQFAPIFTVATALMIVQQAAAADPSQPACYEAFLRADTDRNGVIDTREDSDGYRAALAARGVSTVSAEAISQDEFVRACEAGTFETSAGGQNGGGAANPTTGSAAEAPEQALPKDLGKGDITPSSRSLPETEARARLRASGFAQVDDLSLDQQGVWRGTAVVNGKRVAVAVDGQGDIIGGQ